MRHQAIKSGVAVASLFLIMSTTHGVSAQLRATSPYAEDCITEEMIVRENNWTAKDKLGRFDGNDAHLFAELISHDPMREGSAYSFDTVIVWGGRDVWGGAVAIPFRNRCALGHWFVGRQYSYAASIVEQYRKQESADFQSFLPLPKRNYYQAERYYDEHKYSEAEPLYLEALAEFKKAGPYGPAVNLTLHKIARLYDVIGKFDTAEQNYRLAIAGWRTSLGPSSTQEKLVRTDFANMLRKLGREVEAQSIETSSNAN